MQNVAYLPTQGLDREWFGQELDIRIEEPMMDDGIAGVAGCVEDFEPWRAGARLPGQPASVHSRQPDISQKQDGLQVLFEKPQCGGRLPCL